MKGQEQRQGQEASKPATLNPEIVVQNTTTYYHITQYI